MSVNFASEISLSYTAGIFNMPRAFTRGRRLNFLSEGSDTTYFYRT
jgi:hypothetical protein